jgi:hypothetical protein
MMESSMSSIFRTVLLTGLALAMVACSSGPKIFVNKDPNTNLGEFATFGFSPRLGTDRDDGSQTLLSQFFSDSTRNEMELRGYRYTETNPDIRINFYVSTKEKIRSTSTPTAGGYYGYRGGYYGAYGGYGGYNTTVQQYTEGTVTIDLVNNSTDKLVWEGTAVGRITSEVSNNLREAVGAVVVEIFEEYPTQSGGGGPYIPPKK